MDDYTTGHIEHHITDDIVCPWCGCVYEDTDFLEAHKGTFMCIECGKDFDYEAEISVTWNTWKTKTN